MTILFLARKSWPIDRSVTRLLQRMIDVFTDQSQGHGHHTQAEVREGQVPDEDIPGRPHL